jgi:hypothetical protein
MGAAMFTPRGGNLTQAVLTAVLKGWEDFSSLVFYRLGINNDGDILHLFKLRARIKSIKGFSLDKNCY